MSDLFFSICIPALNEENYIGRLLSGLSNQNQKNFEVILVEGNSDDNTKKVAEKYKNKLDLKIYTVSKRNISFQRNYAVKKSRHNHIVFLDADVLVDRDFIAKLSHHKQNKNFEIAASYLIPESKKITDKVLFSLFNVFFMEPMRMIKPGGVGAFVYIHKNAFEKIGGFNEKMKFVEDFDFFNKAHKAGHKFFLFRNLPFTFSVRRLDKVGRIKWLTQLIKGTYFFYFKGSINDLNSVDYKFGEFGKSN